MSSLSFLFSLVLLSRTSLLSAADFEQNWQRHKQKHVACVVHGPVGFVEVAEVQKHERQHEVAAPDVVERREEASAKPTRHCSTNGRASDDWPSEFVPVVKDKAPEEKVEKPGVKSVPHRADHEAHERGEDPRLLARVELAEVDVVFEPLVNRYVPRGQEVFDLI